MCQKTTCVSGARHFCRVLTASFLSIAAALAQTAAPEWRHIGNSAIELYLAAPAGGGLEQVWYSSDGSRLFVRTSAGMQWETQDFQHWSASAAVPPAKPPVPVRSLPRQTVAAAASAADPSRVYALAGQVFRSEDGGVSWADQTGYRRESIIGGGMKDLAVSPADPEDVVVANAFGLWRSLDGGRTWTGLNDSLPSFPGTRLVAPPQGSRGLRVAADGLGTLEWAPGERIAWRSGPDPQHDREMVARWSLSALLGTPVTSLVFAGDLSYAGTSDGRLWVSSDQRGWRETRTAGGSPVESIFVDPKDSRYALAAVGSRGGRLLRTLNGGLSWEDLAADLADGAVHGAAADRASGFVYAATSRGLYLAQTGTGGSGPVNAWQTLDRLPSGQVMDVKLDAEGNQLYALVQGQGVYATLAPHRLGAYRIVNAADFSSRAAAPGSLLSVLGGPIQAARAGALNFPVLATSATESQIQVPFDASGSSLALALQTAGGTRAREVPLQPVAPAIFVDREGAPLLLSADTGVLLDGGNPAHSSSRVQILATGLGRVQPDWPAGQPGPSENSPQVVTPVRAYLDGQPLEVTRAVLAPGYIGFYLVEVQLPAILNAGPAELYLDAEGQPSNRVRLYLQP